ncbi:DUF4350 domain-containing protein [Streptomyces sp. NPDC003077]|uniref:DUF4350 domain-containing protein n=1 Tax=Streptomyces sp. NPDC003077 TaxID=3154443 RepID=UPI00339E03BC
MTTITPLPSPKTDGTSLSPTTRRLWTTSRGLLLALVLLIVSGVLYAAARSGEQHGSLDPRSADRFGSRALGELLARQGVRTKVVTTSAEAAAATGPDTTLLITNPDLLTSRQLTDLRRSTTHRSVRTVLLAPGADALETLAPGTRPTTPTDVTTLAPACELPAARRAGDAELGGTRYTTNDPKADRCYPADGTPTLVRLPSTDGRDTVVLGAPDILFNHRLAERGNASLALQLLGSHPHLVWYLPSLSDPASGPEHESRQRGFLDLIPAGWRWAFLQLAIAAVLAAFWRARRLGPLVPERLPVAVPAAETTEGHARLYQQGDARDRAAAVLRAATRSRIAPLVGVRPLQADLPDVLLPAVAARLPAASGAPTELHPLLFGPAPSDDKALVALADELDDLEHTLLSQERHVPRDHPHR